MDFTQVTYPEPHLDRTRKLLATHPEVRALFGRNRWTAGFVVLLVGAQVVVAALLADAPWWALLVTAYAFGALANHALWTLIHECTHNLVFESSWANSWLQIVANLPIVVPSAISFRKYHLLHHRFQGDPTLDADLPSPLEARLVRNVWWRKALWLLLFFLAQGSRVSRLGRIPFVDRWYVANFVVQVAFLAGVGWVWGWSALAYLSLSCVFSIGLHPVGARWIQEHYITQEGQETFSYYGPLNRIAFNVGYHNEHHDLMTVPWNRLPAVRAAAPELYAPLHHHTSWTRLLLQFIFDPRLGLYSRVLRPPASDEAGVERRAA